MVFPRAYETKALQCETVHIVSSLAFQVFTGFLLFPPVSIILLNYP